MVATTSDNSLQLGISPCGIKSSGIYANYFNASDFLFYFFICQLINVVIYRLKMIVTF